MGFSLLDPKKWILPDPARVVEALHSNARREGPGERGGSWWVLSSAISPVDFYAYLKSRFGNPNGFAMTLRAPSVENMVHWHYTLECPETILELMAVSRRLEVRAYSVEASAADQAELGAAIEAEIAANRRTIGETKSGFEKWRLFVNPYQRISNIVARCYAELRAVKVPDVPPPPIPASPEESQRFQQDMANAVRVYDQAMQLCVTLDMVAPVMGEAAVNFVMLILAKPEIRKDQRMLDDYMRRAIDVRVKSLHLVCEGFERPITGSDEAFKCFMRVMDDRNDSLHGNIDPRKSVGEEIFFDLRTIPLLLRQRSFSEVVLANALSDMTPQAALDKVDVVRAFVEFMLSRLEADCRLPVAHAMKQLHLGYRASTGTIGVILPEAQVEGYPVTEAGQQTQV